MLKEVMAGTIGEIHECNSAFLVSLSLSFSLFWYMIIINVPFIFKTASSKYLQVRVIRWLLLSVMNVRDTTYDLAR